jgi:uncharacterized membrane protein
MKKITLWDIAAIIIALLPVVYVLYVYNKLPAVVPMHYGADGKPNGYGPRSELLTMQSVIAVVSVLLYLLMKYLPSIDPKKKVKYGERTLQKLGMGIVIFLAALSICMTFSSINKTVDADKLILMISGLLFVFLGNVMYNIKPNYFAGVRTPWTLEDEGTWRATHRLTGKVWVAGGIIMTILRLILPAKLGSYVFLGCLGVMVLVPVIYSYIYYKKHHPKNT